MEETDKHTILIVEDDLFSANYLRDILQRNGYRVVGIVTGGHDALRAAMEHRPDLILMDVMLSDNMSGTEAAVQITRNLPDICIIFITAYIEPEMVEQALRANIFGYLMKPYKEGEILTSIRIALAKTKLLPKTTLPSAHHLVTCSADGSLVFDKSKRQLYRHGIEVELSVQGLKLMEILCNNINHTVSKEQICMHIWNETKSDITIRTLVHRIRLRIGDNIIKSVSGLGYKIKTH